MDLQTVIDIDRQILGLVNGAHNAFLDSLMVILTSGLTWIPLYIALLYLVIKNNESMAQIGLIVGCCALCFFITEFVTEGLVKPAVARPRPGNDPEWMYMVHVVNNRRGLDYSFFSAHAANTFGIAVFFCLLVRDTVFSWLMVTWSLVNCYTRLYLAMHYPSDILVGLAFGASVGDVCGVLADVGAADGANACEAGEESGSDGRLHVNAELGQPFVEEDVGLVAEFALAKA